MGPRLYTSAAAVTWQHLGAETKRGNSYRRVLVVDLCNQNDGQNFKRYCKNKLAKFAANDTREGGSREDSLGTSVEIMNQTERNDVT